MSKTISTPHSAQSSARRPNALEEAACIVVTGSGHDDADRARMPWTRAYACSGTHFDARTIAANGRLINQFDAIAHAGRAEEVVDAARYDQGMSWPDWLVFLT
jgi:hypothetical protein